MAMVFLHENCPDAADLALIIEERGIEEWVMCAQSGFSATIEL